MKVETRRTLRSFCKASLAAGLVLFGMSCYQAKQAVVRTDTTSATPANTRPRTISYDTPTNAAPVQTGNTIGSGVKTLKLASQLMGREMPYRVVIPKDYDTKTADRFTVVYLLHGLTGHFNDWTDRGNVAALADKYNFIIVTPEGNDGWYTDNPSIPNDRYESYLIRELIPEIDGAFRTSADRDHRILAGLSMGGYGAVKFGLKYAEMFSIIGSFSGAFVTANWSEKSGNNKLIGKSLDVVFGALNTDARKTNDVFNLVSGISAERAEKLPYFYLSCGTGDIFIKTNRDFAAKMNEKKIPNEFRTPPGGHEWNFWSSQIRDFLDVVNNRIKK